MRGGSPLKARKPSRRSDSFFAQVHEAVRCIPVGKVATYGQIAALVGRRGGARTVGWALRALKRGSGVPWHRVVNAQGRISLPDRAHSLQRALLEAEGLEFDEEGRIDLRACLWRPDPTLNDTNS